MNTYKLFELFDHFYNYTYTRIITPAFSGIGSKTLIESPLRLHCPKYVTIGDRVFVGRNSWLNALAITSTIPEIRIGDRTSISGFLTISSCKSVTIETDVLIARYCHISDHSHKFDDKHMPILSQGVDKISPVLIKQGAWLGQSVVVCPGVTIGKNSVIGANSVVTKSIPDYCVAAGAPAKVIRNI